MALKSTVVKAELQISDLDRHYYATHNLTVAQHPSETDERLMVGCWRLPCSPRNGWNSAVASARTTNRISG